MGDPVFQPDTTGGVLTTDTTGPVPPDSTPIPLHQWYVYTTGNTVSMRALTGGELLKVKAHVSTRGRRRSC